MMKISAHIEGVTVSTWLGYAKHSKGRQSMPGAQHAPCPQAMATGPDFLPGQTAHVRQISRSVLPLGSALQLTGRVSLHLELGSMCDSNTRRQDHLL